MARSGGSRRRGGSSRADRHQEYANRRLYNTGESKYVTLDDLSEMVRANSDFIVLDAKSGDDITRSVLTQIIFEQESKGQSMLRCSSCAASSASMATRCKASCRLI